MTKLSDYGEFKILSDVVLPIVNRSSKGNVGDDCAYVQTNDQDGWLTLTSDAGPKPLIWNLGVESYYSYGWHSVIANASDLASAGAKPIAIVSSIEAPGDMELSEFQEFFEGLAAASEQEGLMNGGGNIRTAQVFGCHITAVGYVDKGPVITRSECKPGDAIAIIGEYGMFGAAYLKAKMNGWNSLTDEEQRRLTRPTTQSRVMRILREHGLINAATDNSDGMLGSFKNIAESSNCSIEINLDESCIPSVVRDIASKAGVSPWNLAFMWGDWNVVVAVPEGKKGELKEIAKLHDFQYTEIGVARSGSPDIFGIFDGEKRRLNILRHENFRQESFHQKSDIHVKYMLESSLFS